MGTRTERLRAAITGLLKGAATEPNGTRRIERGEWSVWVNTTGAGRAGTVLGADELLAALEGPERRAAA